MSARKLAGVRADRPAVIAGHLESSRGRYLRTLPSKNRSRSRRNPAQCADDASPTTRSCLSGCGWCAGNWRRPRPAAYMILHDSRCAKWRGSIPNRGGSSPSARRGPKKAGDFGALFVTAIQEHAREQGSPAVRCEQVEEAIKVVLCRDGVTAQSNARLMLPFRRADVRNCAGRLLLAAISMRGALCGRTEVAVCLRRIFFGMRMP